MELSMSVIQSGIRSDFLNSSNYKSTLQFASKRTQNFLKYCKIIQRYYIHLQTMTKTVKEKVKSSQNSILQTSGIFKQFMLRFMGVIDEVSTFKIQFYEQLEEVEEDPVKKPTYELLAKASQYQATQTSYKDVYLKLMQVEKKIEQTHLLLKKEIRDAVNYFDTKHTSHRCGQLEELIKDRETLQKEGNSLLDQIYKNTEDFERELMFYRQKMLSGKYKVHQKFHQMSHGTKQCLVSTILSLISEVNDQEAYFIKIQRESMKESTLLHKYKGRHGGHVATTDQTTLTDIIMQATREYQMIIDDLVQLISVISESMVLIGNNTGETHQSGKTVIEELNKLYDNEENPTPEIIETLDLFYFFCQKLADIPTNLHILQVNLGRLRQNISKHSEITLSLVRCGTLGKSRGEGKGMDEIGHLFEQLSYDYINDIIQKVIRVFEVTLGNIKNHFNAKMYTKRKKNVQDSMEISHVEEMNNVVEKRPSKKEMWIWKDFRNSQKYHKISEASQKVKEVQKDIKNFASLKADGGKEIQKFNCSVKSKKDLKGILTIMEKVLHFTAISGAVIIIPYDYVEEVKAEVNIFEKELVVKTSMGSISFMHFPQISRAQVLIQQQIQTQANNQPTVQKKSVQITPEEMEFIANRRQNIEAQRVPIDGMKLKGEVVLENTTIDTVYDVIYSDKPFKFRGKEQVCFMAYVLKKGGGSKYQTTPYDPPGPKFYSLEEDKTFINTPLFSERTNSYEIPLPPIPFMPKIAQSVEQCKLFWLSNSELDYTFRVDSKAPMGDTFYLMFVHRIVQKEKNVHISVYFNYTFVKDTSMKGMISSKSEEEAGNNVTIFINETKKVMKIFGGGGGTQAAAEAAKQVEGGVGEQQDETKVASKGKVAKLQNQNKILIGVLVAVIIVNIILKFF